MPNQQYSTYEALMITVICLFICYLGLGIMTGYPVGPVIIVRPSPRPGDVVVVRLISVPGGRDRRRTLQNICQDVF